MYICNTGLECENCIGGCEKNLEWEDDLEVDFIMNNDLPSRNSKDNTTEKG